MKKMISILMAVALMMLPLLSLAQETNAFDNALANGKTMRATARLDLAQGLVDDETAALLADASIEMIFATEPAAQVGFFLKNGSETLGELVIEIGEGSDLYIRCTLLGSDTIRVDANDAEILIEKTLGYMVSSGMITAEEADMIRSELAAANEQQPAPAPASEGAAEVHLSMFELMTMNYGPLMDAVLSLEDKFVYTTDFTQPIGADAAAEYYGIDLTGEDIAKLVDGLMVMIYSSKTLSGMMDGMQVTSEDIANAFASVKSLGIGAYVAEDGSLVHLTVLPVITAENDDFIGSISYNRKTEDAKVTYTLDLGAAIDAASGEYIVLFNLPLTMTVEEDKAVLSADLLGYKLDLALAVTEEAKDDGLYSEANMTLTLTDPAGEAIGGRFMIAWNEAQADAEYPTETYTMTLFLTDGTGDDLALGSFLFTLSAEEPAGEALADQPYVEPAQMSDEEFAAFAEALLKDIDLTVNVTVVPDAA